MTPGHALAEDFRRIGVALIIAGIIGGFLQDDVSSVVSILASVLGIGLNLVGYWLHGKEQAP